jgi:hypothetical protein
MGVELFIVMAKCTHLPVTYIWCQCLFPPSGLPWQEIIFNLCFLTNYKIASLTLLGGIIQCYFWGTFKYFFSSGNKQKLHVERCLGWVCVCVCACVQRSGVRKVWSVVKEHLDDISGNCWTDFKWSCVIKAMSKFPNLHMFCDCIRCVQHCQGHRVYNDEWASTDPGSLGLVLWNKSIEMKPSKMSQ